MRRFVALLLGVWALVWVVGPQPVPRGRLVETEAVVKEKIYSTFNYPQDVVSGSDWSREEGPRCLAGFGRREIQIVQGVHLAGFSSRATSQPSTGVHDPCCARAIALRDGSRPPTLVLGVDILFVNRLLRDRALARIAVPGERVFFTATHTHSGPGDYAASFAESIALGPMREDAVRSIVDALAGAAEDALADLRPTSIRVARAGAQDLVQNRYWGSDWTAAPLDGELSALVFERGGALAGLLVSFGAHATVIGPEEPLLSADWPGALESSFERHAGVGCCLFAAGCVGSQAPRTEALSPFAGDDFARAEAFGKLVAERVAAAVPGALPYEPWSAWCELETFEIPLPPVSLRLTPDLRLSPLLAGTQVAARAPLSVLMLGRDCFVGFPCEVSGEVSLEMKAWISKRTPWEHLHVLDFAGDYHGYVPRDEYWEEGRYENQLSLHGPHFAEYLTSLARAACGEP